MCLACSVNVRVFPLTRAAALKKFFDYQSLAVIPMPRSQMIMDIISSDDKKNAVLGIGIEIDLTPNDWWGKIMLFLVKGLSAYSAAAMYLSLAPLQSIRHLPK